MSAITDLLGTTGPSANAERFYNMIKAVTDNNYGVISGIKNILEICNNQFTIEEINKFCDFLEITKPGFSCDRISYHGVSSVNTIHIAIEYDINGNRIL